MLNKLCKEAWDIVATSFKNIVADDEDSAVAEIATNVAMTPFTEGLLRNILDLDAGQQVELCSYLLMVDYGATGQTVQSPPPATDELNLAGQTGNRPAIVVAHRRRTSPRQPDEGTLP